jgi:hypothetical protein
VTEQLRQLTDQIVQMRQELADSRRESANVKQELHALRQELGLLRGPKPEQEQLGAVKEEQELLAAKVDDQYQTKVESGSKYRVKLSGLALLTVAASRGNVDSLDLPATAIPRSAGQSKGAFGASVRQSILGLDVTGPTLAGASTRAELRFDFFGGLPAVSDGATSGFGRIRTAKVDLDWKNHSLEVGQDTPFFSPLSPSSLVSAAYPALASAGNIWAWIPQIYVTHRFAVSESSKVVVQYGILDSLTGEIPTSEYNRIATAGERSGQPAYASRLGFQNGTGLRQLTAGVAGYFARQNWGWGRRVDSFAVTADWGVPLGRFLFLSGELYRGKGIGGLGGGASSTVLLNGPVSSPETAALALSSAGGWAQLKYTPFPKWEVNAAYGGDFPRQARPGILPVFSQRDLLPKRNASAFGNFIYRPRGNLLFSLEYRKLWTSPLDEEQVRANHVSLGAGVLF